MVDIGYHIMRGIFLFLHICALLISLLQTGNLTRTFHERKHDVKFLIHYCVLVTAILGLILSLDIVNMFGIISLFGQVILVCIAFIPIEISMCFVICSHFKAHYLSLRAVFPTWYRYIVLTVVIKEIVGLTGVILAFELNNSFFMVVNFLACETWFFSILFIDWRGFFLVRSAINEIFTLERKMNIGESQRSLSSTMDYHSVYHVCGNFIFYVLL